MSQYKIGTVNVINGSPIITGFTTEWLANVQVGNLFKIKGENVIYIIASVDTDTQLTLSANYVGSDVDGLNYQIVRDFTTNLGLAEICAGDLDWPYHLTVGVLRKLDTLLGYMNTNSIVTVDATKTTILSKTLDEIYSYLVEAKVTAKEGDTNRAAYICRALVYRTSGGAATMQGSVQNELTIESDSNWDCTIEVVDNDVQLNVTGVDATTINWTATWNIMER